MTRSCGKTPRPHRRPPTAPPTEIQINIVDLPPEQPYRDNEPGVGVSPAALGPASKHTRDSAL